MNTPHPSRARSVPKPPGATTEMLALMNLRGEYVLCEHAGHKVDTPQAAATKVFMGLLLCNTHVGSITKEAARRRTKEYAHTAKFMKNIAQAQMCEYEKQRESVEDVVLAQELVANNSEMRQELAEYADLMENAQEDFLQNLEAGIDGEGDNEAAV